MVSSSRDMYRSLSFLERGSLETSHKLLTTAVAFTSTLELMSSEHTGVAPTSAAWWSGVQPAYSGQSHP